MPINEIWIIAEIRKNQLTRFSSQLLGAARNLAEQKNIEVLAILMGGEPHHAEELAQKSPKVVHLNDPRLEPYDATKYLHAMWQLIESRDLPFAIITGASAAGLEFMPRLAIRCNTAYASYCHDIHWEGNELVVKRPVYGGKIYEELAIVKNPAILTVRPGAFAIPENLPAPGTIEIFNVTLPEQPGLHFIEKTSTTSSKLDLTEALYIVAGGRGMGSSDNFKLLEELAQALNAAVGCSRAVVDSGWRPHDEQVGKSGKTVSPELYVACGISGAIHHILGMNTSKIVVAINKDPEAAIFKNADYGLVGDALEVIPAFIDALKSFSDKK